MSPIHRNSVSPFLSIINLAARAGVRYSLENPFIYYTTNVIGNLNLLELCREFGVEKYILASTSSLYAGQKMPFKETLPVNEPISPYAASKKSGEVTCYTYHKLYDLDITLVRYFTVYGPAGRPDMSIFRFISWIDQGKTVTIYGDGNQSRDFTYVDDIARGTIMALKPLGFRIINLGGDEPHKLIDALKTIEKKLGKQAKIIYKPFHPADMLATHANIQRAKKVLKWHPEVKLKNGLEATVDWYRKNKSWAASIKL
jgi:nucleoside-diphosphate-sugar epimerase